MAACGGSVTVDIGDAAGGGGSDASDGSSGSSGSTGGSGGMGAAGADAGGDSASTPCSAPDWEGCGSPDCPDSRPGCIQCNGTSDAGLIFICAESLIIGLGGKPLDGHVLLTMQPSFTTLPLLDEEVPFSAGVIVANHGQADRLAYADRGVWTGQPIPKPTDCPKIQDVSTCGGYCGGCPFGQVCTGRSPLHPYGLCIPTDAGVCSLVSDINGSTCKKGEGCFTYTVEPEHQHVADGTGFCMPLAQCQATAANLPGGGHCQP